MVVRLFNLGDWQQLKPGAVLKLEGDQPRLIRIDFNCEAPTSLHLVYPDNTHRFLAVVEGLQTVEFRDSESVHIVASSDGEVWYFTNDGDQIAVPVDGESFTKLMTRAARNPELERIMWQAEQRGLRRERLREAEYQAREQRLMETMERRIAAAAQPPHDPETGEVIEDANVRGVAAKAGAVGDGGEPGGAGGAGGAGQQVAAAPAAKPAGKAAKAGAAANGAT